ncbi:hypothetical protein H4S07_005999 [Coemansia furcata]|uniref:Uncharacterized protein n=1 Tax=Coemansia furcata TaxID=417177 RepID=A0ACC1KY80_9FUNG|nr:hypothetical protein H4S07_005999 [Coemansia furcata]
MLKYKTIDALGQAGDSQLPTTTNRSSAQLEKVRSPIQVMANVRKSLEDHSLAAVVPVTKGIFESAMLALPPMSIDQNTQFPEAIKSSFASFTHTYFSTGSYMAINIPREVVEDIQSAIEENNVVLSVLDKAKDEVLFLLCTDVYSGYRRRMEARNAVSRAAKTTSQRFAVIV